MQATNDKQVTVSFIGYRTMKIRHSLKRPNLTGQIYLEVYDTIKELYIQGYTTFLTGMSDGFEMIAAEAILALKNKNQDVKLIAAIHLWGKNSSTTMYIRRA